MDSYKFDYFNARHKQLLIPVGGNSWINALSTTSDVVTDQGIVNWQNPQTVLSTYIRMPQPGKLKVSVNVAVPVGESKFSVSIGGKLVYFIAKGNSNTEYFVDEWDIQGAGYVKIDLQAISKSSAFYGSIDNFYISGSSSSLLTSYVPNNNNSLFHFGRRGPSVHMNYNTQAVSNIEWFYNEVTVPQNNDIPGSFYMAAGFDNAYYGIQANSPTQKKFLFSVWSPDPSNTPGQVPEAYRVILLRQGPGVTVTTFGNEGNGGQSSLIYNWIPGNTYKFLVRGRPIGNNQTEYTAYFFAPEENTWRLIASFARPFTTTYLTGTHSFLENYLPEYGNKERSVYFGNQWVKSNTGQWIELTTAQYTGDGTANSRYRLDFAGGLNNNVFYLRNCGFFDNYVPINSSFIRPQTGILPSVNLNTLP